MRSEPGTASTTKNYPNEQQLVQMALSRVREIFRGNGVKKESIKIVEQTVRSYNLNANTYLELRPATTERQVKGKTVIGTPAGTRAEAMQHIDQAMIKAARDAAARQQVADVLLKRGDQGFGLSNIAVPLDFLKQEYSWHEWCQTCKGSGKSTCQKCHGKRVENCIKCHARGLMFCPMCRGTGLLQGNNCPRCHAQRYVPCDQCKRSGYMPCRICSATGIGKCPACDGIGWSTHVLTLAPQALTYFEYEAKTIPQGAADMFETESTALAETGKIKVEGRAADGKENVLGASYEVTFPYGEITFALGDKEVKANLFGYKADLPGFPYILDKIIQSPVQELEEAAADMGSVADKIRSATRYRVIAHAYLLASRLPARKAVKQLRKKYPLGLSIGMAEKLVALADTTTLRITRKPRIQGLVGGLVAAAALNGLWYLGGVRAMIAGLLPNPRFDFILDLAPVMIGGMLTMAVIQIMAAKSVRMALGHLQREGQKRPSIMAKTRHESLYAYGGAALLTLAMIEITVQMESGAPYWRNLIADLL